MDKFIYFSTPRRVGLSLFERLLKDALERDDTHLIDELTKSKPADIYRPHSEPTKPIFFGVDWAKDSGMNRGDVIQRVNNVIYVRFVTVVCQLEN